MVLPGREMLNEKFVGNLILLETRRTLERLTETALSNCEEWWVTI